MCKVGIISGLHSIDFHYLSNGRRQEYLEGPGHERCAGSLWVAPILAYLFRQITHDKTNRYHLYILLLADEPLKCLSMERGGRSVLFGVIFTLFFRMLS